MEHPRSDASNQEAYVQKCEPRIRKKKESSEDYVKNTSVRKEDYKWENFMFTWIQSFVGKFRECPSMGELSWQGWLWCSKILPCKKLPEKKKVIYVTDQKCRNYTKKDRFMTFPEVTIYHSQLLHTRNVLTQVSIELKFSLLKVGLCLFRRVYNPAYI